MSQLLTLSRAARLVGVSRGTLQKQIRESALTTFEGKVAITDLLRLYPHAQMEDNRMFTKMEKIKADAIHDLGPDKTTLPRPEVLTSRINSLSRELVKVKSTLTHHAELLTTVLQKLQTAQRSDETHLRAQIHSLEQWLAQTIQSPQELDQEQAQLLARDTFLRVMAAHVKVLPSQHDFWLEGQDSILDAALKAGIALNYGCSQGSCGLCKARVISGEVMKTRHHDYALSEAEKIRGYKLMCCHTAVTDVEIEAIEACRAEDIPIQAIEAKIKKVEPVNDNLFILRLQTPRTQTLRFFAGQSVTLSYQQLTQSAYIASCPCDGRHLEFHLQRGDALSEALFQAATGTSVQLQGPQGSFVLAEDSTRPLLFLAEGIGFAPIKSLIEHAVALDRVEGLQLYWFANANGGHYQSNWCRAWADALDHFNYTLVTLDDDNALAHAVQSMAIDSLTDFEVYTSGSQAFIDHINTLLCQHLTEQQCHDAVITH